MSFSLCIAQTAVIKGKLVLRNSGDEKFLADTILVTLKSASQKDSAIVDKNLAFTFDNVVSDTVVLSIRPRSYPSNVRYRIVVDERKTENLELEYSPVCEYKRSESDKRCPTCHKRNKVIPVVYGLVIFTKKRAAKKYYGGGCVVRDCQPNWFCQRDATQF